MSVFLNETFTGSAGQALDVHTSDSGHSWSRNTAFGASAIPTIASGTALLGPSSAASTGMYSSATPPSANYAVSCLLKMVTVLSGELAGVAARGSTGAKTYYRFHYTVGTGVKLDKVVAGTITQLGTTYSFSLSAGQTATLKLVVDGTSIRGYVNGLLAVDATDAAISGAGAVHVLITSNASGNPAAGLQIDSMQAVTIGSFITPSLTYTPIGQAPETRNVVAFIPPDYSGSSQYPLILGNPTSGGLGTDNTSQMTDGLALTVKAAVDTWPFITVFLQWINSGSYAGREWGYRQNPAALAALKASHSVDAQRCYMMGGSQGAFVALELMGVMSADIAAVAVAEGWLSNREGLLSGNDPSGSWTQDQAIDEVAAAMGSMGCRHYVSASDSTLNMVTGGRATRDRFLINQAAGKAPGYVYSEGAPVIGLDHAPAYNAFFNDPTQYTWLLTQVKSASSMGTTSQEIARRRRR